MLNYEVKSRDEAAKSDLYKYVCYLKRQRQSHKVAFIIVFNVQV